MTEDTQVQEVVQEPTPEVAPERRGPTMEEQLYLQSILDKFNTNPEDQTLTKVERTVLRRIMQVEQEVSELAKQAMDLQKEMEEKQNQMVGLNQQILHKKGQSQGLLDSLLAARE